MPRRGGDLIFGKEPAHGPLESYRCGPSIGHVEHVSPMLGEMDDHLELTALQLTEKSIRRSARCRDANATAITNLKLQAVFVGTTKQVLHVHPQTVPPPFTAQFAPAN
jgi:hypothetical protein